jgi:hypothetical protein
MGGNDTKPLTIERLRDLNILKCENIDNAFKKHCVEELYDN